MRTIAKLEPHQLYRAESDDAAQELILVGGGSPYLWVGQMNGACFGTFSSKKELRKFRDALTKVLR